MTNIEFLREHIEQVENAFDDCKVEGLVEIANDIALELTYWRKILKELETLKAIKKHFNFKMTEEGLVCIQSKQDEDTWDTTACADVLRKPSNKEEDVNVENPEWEEELDLFRELTNLEES